MNDQSSTKPLFASILDESPTEVTVPPPFPEGTYLWTVQSYKYDKAKNDKGTDYTGFELACIQPFDDVNIAELEAVGGCDGKTRELDFWVTKDAVYRLDQFHEACGIDLSNPVTRRQRNDLVLNTQVIGVVKHRIVPGKNGGADKTYWDIVQTAKYGN